MTKPNSESAATRVGLEELSTLCDQMVALSRAGVPLDRGLIELANDLPASLAKHSERIGQQLAAGENLADVVADHWGPFPGVYRSVVEAGIRSGQLTVALEGFARLARQLTELRRLVLSSMVYPIVLLTVLFWISTGLIGRLGPAMREALLDLRPKTARGDWLSRMLDHYVVMTEWFWIVPLSFLAFALLWLGTCYWATPAGARADWMRWIPGAGRLLRNSRLQVFSEVMSLLVQHRVPLPRSLRLAGEATGDPRLLNEAAALADQMDRGERPPSSPPHRHGIPPFLQWSLLNATQSGQLENTLRRAAETYQRRTVQSARWLRRTLPVIFSATLGGLVSVIYAAMVLVPWYAILNSLSAAMEAM